MKITNKFLAAVMVLSLAMLAFTPVAEAQTPTTRTTLGAAQNGQRTTTALTVASSTGMTAGGFLLVNNELQRVTTVTSATILATQRDQGGLLTAHPSGAFVFYGRSGTYDPVTGNTLGVFLGATPKGTCVRASQGNLPVFSRNPNGEYLPSDCVGGIWRQGSVVDNLPAPRVCTEPIGSVAYASVGTSTATVAGTVYVASIQVPQSRLVTGITQLNGATASTDVLVYALYDSSGNVLATTALAGVLSANASTFQDIALTTPYFLTAPGRYFIGVQGAGTTATIRLMATATFVDVLANSRTGTAGAIPAITPPTTFTATTAPVACLY